MYCFNLATLSGESQSPRRDNFSVCHKRKSPLSLTFLYFWFSSCFYFVAPLLSHRIVSPFIYAQSCTINLQNKNNYFKLLGHCNNLCSLCGAHNSTGTQRGRQGEKEGELEKCKCSETLCVSFVSVCVSVVALLSMLHVVQLSWHNLIKGKRSWKSAQNYLSSAAVVKDFSLTFNYLSREGPLFLSFSHSYCLSHSRSIVCFKYLYSRYTYHR